MDRDRLFTVAAQLFAGALFAVSAAGLLVSLQQGDAGGAITGVFAVYLTGLLLAGVLRDATDDRRWQLAFFAGVAVWGGYEYAVTGDAFSLLLAAVGVVMVAANVLDIR